MTNFKSLTREERKQALISLGEKPFREKQIFEWICKGVSSFDDMTNLSLTLRESLKASYSFDSLSVVTVKKSKDGTAKYLLEAPDGNRVESVFMQYEYGNTVCLSTQVGCNMGCVFCASGIDGKIRNLKAWEILDEYLVVRAHAGQPVNHVVLMGMGEPLDNYAEVKEFIKMIHDKDGVNLSLRNITLSTCGIIPKIHEYAVDFPQANLAVSLHRSNQPAREKLMPIAKKYELSSLIKACREYTKETGNRISFEYALIDGENDRDEDVKELTSLLKGMNCHINLIPLNNVTESGLKGSSRENAEKFAQKLEKLGIPTTVRRSLGEDIDAACGQLRKNYTC